MSKENIRRHASMLRKANQGDLANKEDNIGSESEPKLSGSMGDAAKNIQNRIKMKKRNSKISERFLNSGGTSDLHLGT